MEKFLHHLGCKQPVNNGINYLSTGAGFLPSRVALFFVKKVFFFEFAHGFSGNTSKIGGLSWSMPTKCRIRVGSVFYESPNQIPPSEHGTQRKEWSASLKRFAILNLPPSIF